MYFQLVYAVGLDGWYGFRVEIVWIVISGMLLLGTY
jgi:hypothetical protein